MFYIICKHFLKIILVKFNLIIPLQLNISQFLSFSSIMKFLKIIFVKKKIIIHIEQLFQANVLEIYLKFTIK